MASFRVERQRAGRRGSGEPADRGQRVSQAPNDQQELEPTRASVPVEAGGLAVALVDSGFYRAAAVPAIEQTAAGAATGTTV